MNKIADSSDNTMKNNTDGVNKNDGKLNNVPSGDPRRISGLNENLQQ